MAEPGMDNGAGLPTLLPEGAQLVPDLIDAAFLEKFPAGKTSLVNLRLNESIIINRGPDEEIVRPALYVDRLLQIAGNGAIPVILKNYLLVISELAHSGRLPAHQKMIGYYLSPCLSQDQALTQDCLGPVLGSAWAKDLPADEMELVRGSTLLYSDNYLNRSTKSSVVSSMRIGSRNFDGKSLRYFGKDFTVAGLEIDADKNLYISEIDVGLLLVHDTNGKPSGMVDVHPDLYDYDKRETTETVQFIGPEQIARDILARDLPGDLRDQTLFWEDFVRFFDESAVQGRNIGGPWSRKTQLNINALGVEAKYTIWKLLTGGTNPKSEVVEPTMALLNFHPTAMPSFLTALEGDRGVVSQLGSRGSILGKLLHWEFGGDSDKELRALYAVHFFLDKIEFAEKFIVDTAYFMTPKDERTRTNVQERVDFLQPLVRGIAREAAEAMVAIKTARELESAGLFFGFGVAAVIDAVTYLRELYDPVGRPETPFDPRELRQIQDDYRQFPGAHQTYEILLTRWICQAMWSQKDQNIKERRAWLREFIGFVTADAQIYSSQKNSENKGARVYREIGDINVERLANGLITLHKAGIMPDHPKILVLGSGPGSEVEGPAIKRAIEASPALSGGLTVMLDMNAGAFKDRWPEAQFIHGVMEDLAIAPGSIDCIIMYGSVPNNIGDWRELMRYMEMISNTLGEGRPLINETGSPLLFEEVNSRYQAMLRYNRAHREEPFGGIFPIPAYEKFFAGKALQKNADIFEHPLMLMMGRLVGLELYSPAADPKAFAGLIQDLSNWKKLAQRTLEDKNCVTSPFVLVGAERGVAPSAQNPASVRATYTYIKRSSPSAMFRRLVVPHVAAATGQTAV